MNFEQLPAFDQEFGAIHVVLDTPKGSRNKFPRIKSGSFWKLLACSPAGDDFRFIPKTPGGDRDPLNVLVLMDKPAFTGCMVYTRLIGVMAAKQSERQNDAQ